MLEFFLLSFVLIAFCPLYDRVVGINFSATSIFLGTMWLIYGVGYVIFSRLFGPGIFEFLMPHDSSNRLAGYSICAREVGQYTFILQTSINHNVIATLDLALSLVFMGLIAGCFFSNRIFNDPPQKLRQEMNDWINKPVNAARVEHSKALYLLILSALTFTAFFAVKDHQLAKVTEYFVSQAGEFQKIKMRQSAGGSESYFFNLMLATVLPFLCFYLVALDKAKKHTLHVFTLMLIGMVTLAKLALLSKAPVVVFLTQIFLVLQLRRSVNLRQMLPWITLIVLSLLMLMIFVANPDLEGFEGISFFLYRVFIAPNEALLEYFSSIPQFIAHTQGYDNRFIAYLLHTTQLEATHFRVSELYRGVKGYSTNTMFLGMVFKTGAEKAVERMNLAT